MLQCAGVNAEPRFTWELSCKFKWMMVHAALQYLSVSSSNKWARCCRWACSKTALPNQPHTGKPSTEPELRVCLFWSYMGWKAIQFPAAVCGKACHAFVIMLPDHQTSHTQPTFYTTQLWQTKWVEECLFAPCGGETHHRDGQFPIPDGQFSIPDGQFPIPDGQFTIPADTNCCL